MKEDPTVFKKQKKALKDIEHDIKKRLTKK
jgi:hypothetical protein